MSAGGGGRRGGSAGARRAHRRAGDRLQTEEGESRSRTSRHRGCSPRTRTGRTASNTWRSRRGADTGALPAGTSLSPRTTPTRAGHDRRLGRGEGGVPRISARPDRRRDRGARTSTRRRRRARRPLGRLRPHLQPVVHRGAEPGQGGDLPRPRGVRDPGKDGMVRVVQATAPRRTSSSRPTWPTPRTPRPAAATGCTATGRSSCPTRCRRVSAARAGDGRRARRHAALPAGVRVHRSGEPRLRHPDRKTAIVTNYIAHVGARSPPPRRSPGRSRRPAYIREPITGPAVTALFTAGSYAGARSCAAREPVGGRQHDPHRRLGACGSATCCSPAPPARASPRSAMACATLEGEQEVIQLGLANDQLGYLIAPVRTSRSSRRKPPVTTTSSSTSRRRSATT